MEHIGDLFVTEEIEAFVEACFDFDSKIQPEEPHVGSSIESLDSNKQGSCGNRSREGDDPDVDRPC